MIQVGTELKAPANAKEGQSINIRRDGKTIICRAEARTHGLVLVVVGMLQDIPLQKEQDKAYLIYDTVKP